MTLEERIRTRIADLTRQIADVEMHMHFEIAARRKTIEELEDLLKEPEHGIVEDEVDTRLDVVSRNA
jgi:trehalose utilization protein